jgi:serine phosphatase RsbU (regulator of sigma subunit)
LKIYLKYSLLLTVLLVLSAGSIIGLALFHHSHALRREALLRGESIAVNLALVSADAVLTGELLQLMPLTTDATIRHENVVYAAVVDQKGLVLAHPDREALRKPLAFKPLKTLQDFGVQAQVEEGLAQGRKVWDVSVPVKAKGSLVELGRVHVGLDRAAVESSVRRSLAYLLELSLLFLLAGLSLAFVFVRYLVRPLQALSKASAQVGRGDFSVRVPVSGSDEVADLGANFNQMVEDLHQAEERRKTAQRMESELAVAHSIQKDLFPSKAPQLKGWETAFSCVPATELGGDYYDWYPVAGGQKIGFLVADVSGKGVPAALHSANLRSLMRSTSQAVEAPEEVLRRVNRLAFADLGEKAFVTMIYGVLDPGTGRFDFVNAGHDPLLWSRGGGKVEALQSSTFPIGMVDGDDFDAMTESKSIQLDQGDLLFMFTDGVTEAEDGREVQFGLDRIAELISGRGARQAVEKVQQDLSEYTGGRPPHDDVTLLALSRRQATA